MKNIDQEKALYPVYEINRLYISKWLYKQTLIQYHLLKEENKRLHQEIEKCKKIGVTVNRI